MWDSYFTARWCLSSTGYHNMALLIRDIWVELKIVQTIDWLNAIITKSPWLMSLAGIAFLLFFFFLGVYWSLFLHGDSYTVQFFRFSKGNKTFFHTYNCTKALFYSGTNPVLLYCSLAWFKLNIVACECTSFKSKLDNTVKSHVPCAPDWWIRKTNSHLACYVNTLFSSIFKSRYSYWVWYQQIPHNIYLL